MKKLNLKIRKILLHKKVFTQNYPEGRINGGTQKRYNERKLKHQTKNKTYKKLFSPKLVLKVVWKG